MIKSLEERFWSKVKKTESCWIWTGAATPEGYGGIWDGPQRLPGYRSRRATHVAFYLQMKRWPVKNMLHKCDNPRCVRFDHLFEGGQSDNMKDCVSKGRNFNASKKVCKQGHLLSAGRIRRSIRNGRQQMQRECLECKVFYREKYKQFGRQ